MRRPLLSLPLLLALAATPALVGCTPSTHGPEPRLEGPITPIDVKDDAFATSVQQVLKDGTPSIQRLGLLTGVVRAQLRHAAKRFQAGQVDRATRSVMGALYLLRVGEGRAEMVDAEGAKALAGAIDQTAGHGDEGRSLVLMRMREAALPQGSPERAELDEHLRSLDEWMRQPRAAGAMVATGSTERAAVARALIDPSDAALDGATAAIEAWAAETSVLAKDFDRTGVAPPREAQNEYQRAMTGAGDELALTFLRYGDAKGAFERVDRGVPKQIFGPLLQYVKRAANDDKAADWFGLTALLTSRQMAQVAMEAGIDEELLHAAIFGTSVEAYRRDSSNVDLNRWLAQALVAYGLPEAAPLVMIESLKTDGSQGMVNACLDVVAHALESATDGDDVDTVRRIFAASQPILAAADRPELKGRVEPSPAAIRVAVANVEIRAGNLAAAKPLLEQATAAQPSVSGFLTRAMVERQSGNGDAALKLAGEALQAADAPRSPLDVADAWILSFEVNRDANRADQAKAALDHALAAVLVARQSHLPARAQARAERLLGRVLDGYGDAAGASRALDRALQAAGQDRPALGATMLDAVGRALVRKDLTAARAALKRGIDGEVSDEDLVYAGLWVSLLEQELKVPPDGEVERALAKTSHRSWTGKLAGWANGKISDADLSGAAQSSSQKVEAAFYTTMKRRVAGDPKADASLREIAASPNLELLEVQLARELTAPPVRPGLPQGVKIP